MTQPLQGCKPFRHGTQGRSFLATAGLKDAIPLGLRSERGRVEDQPQRLRESDLLELPRNGTEFFNELRPARCTQLRANPVRAGAMSG